MMISDRLKINISLTIQSLTPFPIKAFSLKMRDRTISFSILSLLPDQLYPSTENCRRTKTARVTSSPPSAYAADGASYPRE